MLSYCLYYFGIGSAAETTRQSISECAALSALVGQGNSCPWKWAAVQGLSRERAWRHLPGLQAEEWLQLGHAFSSLAKLRALGFSFSTQKFCATPEFLRSVW